MMAGSFYKTSANTVGQMGKRVRSGRFAALKRLQAPMERWLFPVILLLWPLAACRQGASLLDPTYSLGNYAYLEGSGSTWFYATFLSNKAGELIQHLPGGNTMAGMNVYCSLLVSLTSLIVYYVLKRMIAGWMVFLGEWIAIALFWCPSVILYNTLTSLFLSLAVCCLFLGVSSVPQKKYWFFLAGMCLGVNVTVRLSNAVQVLLILPVLFYCSCAHLKVRKFLQICLLCVCGFAAGFTLVMIPAAIAYGGGWFEMIPQMLSASDGAQDYTIGSMLADTLRAYGHSLEWFLIAAACVVAGIFFFNIPFLRRHMMIKKLIYDAGILVLIRFWYSRGMFTVNYQDYPSMFEWGMQMILMTYILCLFGMAGAFKGTTDERFLSAAVLMEMLILPLGSNNYTYPVLDCMFITAPYCIWMLRRLWQETRGFPAHLAWHRMAVMMLAMLMIQASLFHISFAFRDGTDGTSRSVMLKEPPAAEGMYTTPQNAEVIRNTAEFVQTWNLAQKKAIIFGNIPGMHYLLQLPPALSTLWPDLDSYPEGEMEEELSHLTEAPLVMTCQEGTFSYANDEAKYHLLQMYMQQFDYSLIYDQDGIRIYQAQ